MVVSPPVPCPFPRNLWLEAEFVPKGGPLGEICGYFCEICGFRQAANSPQIPQRVPQIFAESGGKFRYRASDFEEGLQGDSASVESSSLSI